MNINILIQSRTTTKDVYHFDEQQQQWVQRYQYETSMIEKGLIDVDGIFLPVCPQENLSCSFHDYSQHKDRFGNPYLETCTFEPMPSVSVTPTSSSTGASLADADSNSDSNDNSSSTSTSDGTSTHSKELHQVMMKLVVKSKPIEDEPELVDTLSIPMTFENITQKNAFDEKKSFVVYLNFLDLSVFNEQSSKLNNRLLKTIKSQLTNELNGELSVFEDNMELVYSKSTFSSLKTPLDGIVAAYNAEDKSLIISYGQMINELKFKTSIDTSKVFQSAATATDSDPQEQKSS